LQAGIAALDETVDAAMVALGDQPQIEAAVAQALLTAYAVSRNSLVIPSFNMRRGHPMIVDRRLWPALLRLRAPDTLRDLLAAYGGEIHYVPVESATIFLDLDTPEDFERYRPRE
jgi:molybdenum cofactor cytidylyltransferase